MEHQRWEKQKIYLKFWLRLSLSERYTCNKEQRSEQSSWLRNYPKLSVSLLLSYCHSRTQFQSVLLDQISAKMSGYSLLPSCCSGSINQPVSIMVNMIRSCHPHHLRDSLSLQTLPTQNPSGWPGATIPSHKEYSSLHTNHCPQLKTHRFRNP